MQFMASFLYRTSIASFSISVLIPAEASCSASFSNTLRAALKLVKILTPLPVCLTLLASNLYAASFNEIIICLSSKRSLAIIWGVIPFWTVTIFEFAGVISLSLERMGETW